jgi:LCP family protein required for cell wall assembly
MTPTPSHPPRSWLAALLSFLVPGLGQAYLGYWSLAALLAAPVVVLAVLLGAVVATGADGALNRVLSATFLVGVFVLNLALFGWRLFAIAHAGLARPAGWAAARMRSTEWSSRLTRATLTLLITASVGIHLYVGSVVLQLQSTLDAVFEQPTGGTLGGNPLPSGAPPAIDPWDGVDRITFLLVGVDSAPGRGTALTDTLLVVSIDPASKEAEMISIPRDTGFMPLPTRDLYADGLYPAKINQLATEAAGNPAAWCPDMDIQTDADAESCGLAALRETIGLYIGVPIDYSARIDFAGFEQLIDALGGVELCLPGRLVDPSYTDPSTGAHFVLDLPSGCSRYSGADALAYARSRKGWIELADGTREPQNDFLRAGRQQQIILALRAELSGSNLVFRLPDVLEAVGSTVSTDFPRSRAGDLAELAPLVSGPDITRLVLGYPEYVTLPTNPDGNYLLVPVRERVRAEMAGLFGEDELVGWYAGSADGPP